MHCNWTVYHIHVQPLLSQAGQKDIRQILFSVGTSVRWGVLHSFYEFRREKYCDVSSAKGHSICQMYSFSADLDICLYIFAFVYLHPNIWYLGTNAHPLEGAGQSTNHRLYQIPNTKSVIYFQSVSAQCFMFYSDLNFLYINEIFKAIWHIWMGSLCGHNGLMFHVAPSGDTI